MLFNSIEFAIFLPIVFLVYWYLLGHSVRKQNLFLLAASYVFYGWWDWRFLGLIIFSSALDFFIGRKLSQPAAATDEKRRKLLLFTSLFFNLGLLGVFKYYNFFAENLVAAFSLFGQQLQLQSLKVILPVGISFYTFQTLSYSIDVYRRKIEHTDDWVQFFAFVSFFPQLVAGPIERARDLLPQFARERHFDYDQAVDGMRQMLWGFFKKNCHRRSMRHFRQRHLQ